MDLAVIRNLSPPAKLLACRRAVGLLVGVPVGVGALNALADRGAVPDIVSSTLLLASAVGIISAGLDRMFVARVAGAYVSILSLAILLDNGVVVGLLGYPHPFFETAGGVVTSAAMRENKAIVYAMIGVALLTIERVESIFGRIILSSLLGLIVFSIGALSSLGYSLNGPAVDDWQLFARISLTEAGGLTVIGLAIIALSWSRTQLEKESLASLGRATYVFTAAGVFTVALLSAGFGALGLGESVSMGSRLELQQALIRRSIALDHFMSKYKLLAAHLSNNPDSVQLLEKLNEEGKPSELERNRISTSLEYTSTLSDEILGVARFDAKNQLIASAGRQPELAVDAALYTGSDSFHFAGPFLKESRFYLYAVSPMVDGSQFRTGTDVLVLDGQMLSEILSNTSGLGKSAKLYLSSLHGSSREIFGYFGRDGRLQMKRYDFDANQSGNQLSWLLDPNSAKLPNYTVPDRAEFHAATIQAPWQLYLSVPREELLTRSKQIIVHSLSAAALLAAFSATVLLFFSRKLIRQTLELQEQLEIAGENLLQEAGRRELAERLAKRREKETRLIVNKTSDAIVSFYCADGAIRSFSPAAQELFGYSEEELHGRRIDALLPELGGFWERPKRGNGNHQNFPVGENEGLKKDGSKFPVTLTFESATLDDQDICFGLFHDLSEQKRTEAAMRHSAKEKEILLREVHHRVKNNLQIISSLFRLQSRRTMDEKIGTLLEESQNRIQSIALVHETLYRSDDFSRIQMSVYLREIVDNLKRSLEQARNVDMRVEAENVALALDFAIPCGLMVNELVTNSIRHAFHDPLAADGAEVVIEMRETAGEVALTVSDNGAGLPEDFDIHASRSLGMRLIHILASQVEASLEVERDHGVRFIVLFNNNPAVLPAQQDTAWQERKF